MIVSYEENPSAQNASLTGEFEKGKSLKAFLRAKEKEYLKSVIKTIGGDKVKVAQELNISLATLCRKLPEENIDVLPESNESIVELDLSKYVMHKHPKKEVKMNAEQKVYPFIVGGLIHDSFSTITSIRANTEKIQHDLPENIKGIVSEQLFRLERGAERLEKTLRLIQSMSQPFYKLNSQELAPPYDDIENEVREYEDKYPQVLYKYQGVQSLVIQKDFPVGVATFIVGELLDNASVACSQFKNPQIKVIISLEEEDQSISIKCVDNGPGLTSGKIKAINSGSIFPPEKPGRGGYGLYLMTQIALRLAGNIKASNLDSGGAQLVVTLKPKEAING